MKFAWSAVAAFAAASSAATVALADEKMTAVTVVSLEDDNLLKFGTLNVTTGEYTRSYDMTIALPHNESDDCRWAPLEGTEGVGTATFHVNRSYFVMAQQLCGPPVSTRVNQTVLVATRVAMYQNGDDFIFNSTEYSEPLSSLSTPADSEASEAAAGETGPEGNATIWHSFPGHTYDFPLASWNIVWDHACNYVVVAPRRSQGKASSQQQEEEQQQQQQQEVVYETWMISEYDAQARQQKDLQHQPQRPRGWAKVNGLGAMDFYAMTVGGPWEMNCGSNCSLFSLEEFGGPTGPSETETATPPPSRIVGRNFHTGEVLSNVSNVQGVRMFASPSDWWNFQDPQSFVMIGIGMCCTEAGCDQSDVCRNSPDAATLVAYGGSGAGRSPLTTLTTIGKAKDYNDTMRLGVVLTAGYSNGALQQPMRGPNAAVDPAVLHAYVYVDGVIETYEIVEKNASSRAGDDVAWSAQKISSSKKSTIPTPQAWTIGPYSWPF